MNFVFLSIFSIINSKYTFKNSIEKNEVKYLLWMEDKEISLYPPPQPLIKLPQATMPLNPLYVNSFSRPNEGNKSIENPKINPRQLLKNSVIFDYQVEKILSDKSDQSTGQNIYLVKFKNRSYHELRWIPASEFGTKNEILDEYLKNEEEKPAEPYFNQNFLIPEKIFSVKKIKQQRQFLVKWVDLDYCESTWENEAFIRTINENYNKDHNLIGEFEERIKITNKNPMFLSNSQNFHPILELHTSKMGDQLDSCQIDIVNFLLSSWCFLQNALISGIEGSNFRPGVVTFLEKIITQGKGGFLIISDQSLIEKWESDIFEWTDIPFLTFMGRKENLEVMKKYEFSKPGSTNNDFIYPIYITTCENLMSYHKIFSQCTWECIILDDSQIEKVTFDKANLNFIVNKLKMKYKVFMTPPLEDVDLHSIWPWLNFIDPNNFHLESRFAKSFCKDGKVEVERLNNNNSFAHFDESNNKDFRLTEIFIKCPLSEIQEESIKMIYEPLINNQGENFIKNSFNMRKIGLATRKILDHPFLMKDVANKVQQEKKKSFSSTNYSVYDSEIFLKSSGKLFVLDMLLKKFKSESKNVVIICQTSDSIEILEKYMLAKFYSYEKVDLFKRGRSRYDAVMQFNDESKRIFAFILDAKTGYFSMKADYVVIYESDWNPRNDIFIANKILSSRKKKEIYRLVTEKTFEIAFIDDLPPEPVANKQIAKLVQFGLEEMLSEKSNEENSKLLQFLDSEQNDPDDLIQNNTLTKNYTSIKEMSESIPFKEWRQLEKKSSVKKEESAEKVKIEKKDIDASKENLKSSENDFDDEDDEENDDESETSVEEEDFNEQEYNEIELKGDSKGWTPKIIFHLFNLMLKHGIMSWEDFAKSIPLPVAEIKNVGFILINELLSKTENIENYVILQKYFERLLPTNFESNKIEFIQEHQKEIDKITSSRVDWKLDRLEFLYIVDISFHAREKSNGDKTIPSFRPSTLENDTKIIEIVKKRGFPIKKLNSFLKNMKMTVKKANSRAINLIEELREIFLDYCQTFELDEELTTDKLIDSLKMLNSKEKKKVYQAIQLVGIDNLDAIFETAKLKKDRKKVFVKYIEQFKKFSYTVIKNKKVPYDFFGVHYSLKTLTEVILNIAILKYLREVADINSYPEKDRTIFQYLIENGFKNIKKEEIFVGRFSEPLEQSLIEFLHSYFNNKKKLILNNLFKGVESPITSPVKSEPSIIIQSTNDDLNSKLSQLSKYIDFNLPEGTALTDKEIEEMLPIKINENTIITNLGKVVTDRPNFHNERYLYLNGYTAERYFTSVRDPSTKEWYILRIKDTGGDYPLFTIESKEDPSIIFEGNAPSKPSIELLKRITAVKNKSKASTRSPTISGPEFFGFAPPKVRKIMERLPGAEKCPKFKGLSNVLSDQIELKKVKTDEPEPRKLQTRNNKIIFINDDNSDTEYMSESEPELEDDEDDEEEIENEEEEEEEGMESENDEKEYKFRSTKKIEKSISISTRGRKKKVQSDDDSDYGENYDSNESNYDGDDDDKSLVQRVKERYLKGKVRPARLEKRYNLRKRTKQTNYNEYDNEEEEYDEYDEDNEGYDEEEENEYSEYDRFAKIKSKNKKIKQIKRPNKRIIKTKSKFDDDAGNYEYDSNFYDGSNANSDIEKEPKSKYSPNKTSKGDNLKSKDKKTQTGVTHLSDSSDENNYFDFACNILPDVFYNSQNKMGSKSNKNNVLKSGVVFYFDKLTKKPAKEYLVNFFGEDFDDSNMLCVDRTILEEFISVNPQFSHYFSNK